ncbi:MAG: sodium ion-translocating decarboxylase subunit beta [Bacteroides sp.]|nr:sodium ion-translocating decarboxylase subunit beta [Eubacterium sp.]MCM1417948.1 sodium ion-translocating decarboxylase subunit beta [Roseburia sp.]MCM1461805.1 sodium ion-translocating decarboxylase subunit beta [Bacteroides sp.]
MKKTEREQKNKLTGAILTGIGTVAAGIGLLSSGSVGVIGGADGSTAVFVGGASGGAFPTVAILAGVALLAVGVALLCRKQKGK